GVIDRHLRREAEDDDLAADRGDDGDVVAVGGVDGDGVDLAVAGRAADRRGQVDGDLGDVGAAEIVNPDVVAPAQSMELDALDIVQVHGDVGDVAREERAPTVGEDVDVLGDVGAVEEQGIDAVLTLDGVVVVAGVPDERVVAGAEQRDVVAVAAVDRVVALAADHDVVAEAAVHLQADLAGGEAAGVDDIVAAESIDDQLVAGFGMIEDHLRLQAADDDLAADRGDGDDVVAIGGIDGHAVDLLVADCSADDTGQID